MKTPEEIKRGLECCLVDDEDNCVCEPCPYARCGSSTLTCDVEMGADARAYIRQLERELEWAKAFAKGRCIFCKWHFLSTLPDAPCKSCIDGRYWEWRGVEEDAK